jgi:uncharacterized membrane protein
VVLIGGFCVTVIGVLKYINRGNSPDKETTSKAILLMGAGLVFVAFSIYLFILYTIDTRPPFDF